ncbi:MAG: PD40 domain-containing protein [Planctomycetes bacterium]|nr:PD40 domain-containing protein [Planctomycetota bacterium]
MKYVPCLLPAILLALLAIQPEQTVAQDSSLPEIATNVLRQPALSPDGNTLAFVYDGDIWSVPSKGGHARRLTITEDNDGSPCFSPDGRWLSFRSRRYGNDDVFVMPAEGGTAKRLTFADSYDAPDCWLPDSSGIIFNSYRRENGRDLWIVRLEGGEPWPITGGGFGLHEYQASITPNGKHIAYCTSGSDPARRRAYNGTADSEIWLCDFDGVVTTNHRRLTNNRSHDAWPVFTSDTEMVYVTYADGKSASSQIGRLTAMGLDGKTLQGWGGETRLDPKDISVRGGKIAFATGNYSGWKLHVGELGKRPPTKLSTPDIKLASDVRRAETQTSTLTSADEYAVSPDGKKLAFIAGGDVFVMPVDDDAVPYQVTDTPKKEVSIVWAPDSLRLTFLDHLDGVVMTADMTDFETGGPKISPAIPADATVRHAHPAYDSDGNLWALENEASIRMIADKSESPMADRKAILGNFHGGGLWGGDAFQISADGRWVLYEQSNELYDDVIMLADAVTGEGRALSHLFGSCGHARFSADGKRVVFINNQEGDYDVYSVELAPEAPTFKEDKLDKLFKKPEPKEDKTDDAGNGNDKPEPKKPEVRVEWEGIKDRAKRITSLDGRELYPVALPDGKTYFFVGTSQGQSNVWKLVLDPDKGPDLKQITQSRSSKSALSLSADGKTLWWLDSGKITSMPVASTKTTTYNFRVEQRRNRMEVRNAAFDEAAWVMGSYFYDSNHHGINWNATTARYKQALDSVSTGDEYDALMDEMLGELNSSHQGFTGVDSRSDGANDSTGCLTLMFEPKMLADGRYQVTEVVKGGPCDLPEGKPEPGAILLKINGRMLSPGDNMAEIMLGAIGRKTVLTFTASESTSATWDVAVKPISRRETYGLYYDRWVQFQRDLVERLSDGRLGYVHIQAMNGPSLADFKHELGDEMLDKEGVVIDVRYNGGGSTSVDILEILIKRTWLKRQYGGMNEVSENIYRSIALEKPSILMINQASFSNAEIMAEGFRQLGIGTVVGVDTAGGCIGTGSYTLLDGSRMRLPSTGAYTVDGENLELVGRKPDIFVENTPDELDKGIDRQTERTVKELLAQMDR